MDNELCRQVLSAHTYETAPTEDHPDGQVLSNWFPAENRGPRHRLRRPRGGRQDRVCGGVRQLRRQLGARTGTATPMYASPPMPAAAGGPSSTMRTCTAHTAAWHQTPERAPLRRETGRSRPRLRRSELTGTTGKSGAPKRRSALCSSSLRCLFSQKHRVLLRQREVLFQHVHMGQEGRIVKIFGVLRTLADTALTLDAGAPAPAPGPTGRWPPWGTGGRRRRSWCTWTDLSGAWP